MLTSGEIIGQIDIARLKELLDSEVDAGLSRPMRNTIYRGAFLGNAVTNEQWAEIKAGTFRGMFLGDYWFIDGRSWVIADFNYLRHQKTVSANHVIVISRDTLYRHRWNNTDTTSGGYINSELYKTGLNEATQIVKSAFGEKHLKEIGKYYSNATDSSGNITGTIAITKSVVIPSEIELYGARIISNRLRETVGGSYIELNTSQFSVFKIMPRLLKDVSYSYWLSDIADGSNAKIVAPSTSTFSNASNVDPGVRVYCAIGNEN